MKLGDAVKHVESAVMELEKELYNFQNVAIPRYEKDKQILKKMKDDLVKLEALAKKHKNGEDVTAEELEVVPEAFR